MIQFLLLNGKKIDATGDTFLMQGWILCSGHMKLQQDL